jgi:two-component system OmpR family response regulator
MEELMARLRALLRRSTGQVQPIMTIGVVSVDPRTQQVSVDGVSVNLTPLEYRLVSYLFHHRDRVVSQSELGDALYAHDNDRDSNAIEALVGRLRKKLKVKVIETRRGFGYIATMKAP